MKVTPVSVTTGHIGGVESSPESLIVYCARVSNPANQHNHGTGARLLRYCIEHGHWSVFEMVDWTVEIETSRAIAAQILRHRSFSFQEFSQRYSEVGKLGPALFEHPEMRARGSTNRQGSDEAAALPRPHDVEQVLSRHLAACEDAYRRLLDEGVAPECARMVMPLCTRTRLYMKGSVRSWIHYLQVRCDGHAQKEHRDVAEAVKGRFISQFPVVSEALGWGVGPAVKEGK